MNASSRGYSESPSSVRLCADHPITAKSVLLAAALGIAFPACVSRPDKAYFEKPGSWNVTRRIDCPGGCPRDENTRYFVTEFNDHGVARIQAQLDDAVAEIKAFKPKNVLVYVHGWHNDTSPDRGEAKGKDMNDLDGLLHRMVKEGKVGKTLAIYVGWRGELRTGLSTWFTLSNRRAVAGRIGSGDALTQFLGDVAKAGRAIDAKVIFTGHSLGAALLEKAAAKMIDPPQGTVDQQRLPHLFLLANSAEVANASSRQAQLINRSSLAVKQGEGTKLLSPLVLAVTSEKDDADRKWNFVHNYLERKLQLTTGFDPRLRTHRVLASNEARPVVAEEVRDLQFRLAREARLDPAFWVLNAEQTMFTLYRMHPLPLSERKSPFSHGLIRCVSALVPGFDPPVEISHTNNELFWNVLIPGELCADHNDVYNERMMGAAMNWLRIAQPQLLTQKDLPHDLPELLNALRSSILGSASGSAEYQEESGKVKQYVMAAATRMPRNEKCIKMLLQQLASPAQASAMSDSAEFRYRANLFYVLKFTHDSNEAAWTPANHRLLTQLMQRPEMWKALAKAGDVESSPETDKNLNAFYEFLRLRKLPPN